MGRYGQRSLLGNECVTFSSVPVCVCSSMCCSVKSVCISQCVCILFCVCVCACPCESVCVHVRYSSMMVCLMSAFHVSLDVKWQVLHAGCLMTTPSASLMNLEVGNAAAVPLGYGSGIYGDRLNSGFVSCGFFFFAAWQL